MQQQIKKTHKKEYWNNFVVDGIGDIYYQVITINDLIKSIIFKIYNLKRGNSTYVVSISKGLITNTIIKEVINLLKVFTVAAFELIDLLEKLLNKDDSHEHLLKYIDENK